MDEVRYRVACTDAGGEKNIGTDVIGGNTGTTYDKAMAGNDTRIPIIWWLTLGISGGINYATTSSFRCFEDIKGLDQQLRNLTIGDEALREEYGRFANECFLPAKSKYVRALRGGERHDYVVNAANIWLASDNRFNVKTDVTDLHFIGSHFYLETDGFYKSFDKTANCRATASGCGFQAEKPVPGWPYVPDRDSYGQADFDAGTAGRPFCDEWWEGSGAIPGLEDKLLGSIEAAKVVSDGFDSRLTVFQNVKNMISDTYTDFVYTDDEIEDLVIKRYVASDPPELTGKWKEAESNELGNNLLGGAALLATFPAAVAAVATVAVPAGLATGAEIAKTFGGFYTAMFVLKTAAPMLQAVLLMMIYALLLIYLVVSEYDVDSVITAMILILAVRFFTPLWAAADYLDAQMFVSMFPDATWLGSDVTFAFERLLLDMVLTVLYVVAPLLLLALMQMAGQSISRMGVEGMNATDVKGSGKGVGTSVRKG